MEPKHRKWQVCLSPLFIPLYDLRETIAVVIDVFRATTSMCYGLANGAQAIIPVASLEACLAYQPQGFLLAAERDGKVVEGFDFGNSPFSYEAEKVSGQTVVLTTTNGTKAIQACTNAEEVLIASLLNAKAVAHYLQAQSKHVLLICAGWKDHAGLEDVVCAGKILHEVGGNMSQFDDAALIAHSTYLQAKQEGLGTYLQKASHTKRMQGLNLQEDIALCLQEDILTQIPVLVEDRLVIKNQSEPIFSDTLL